MSADGPDEAHLRVDLDALAANFATSKREAGGAEVAPVVKADAYGLGAAPVARRLWAEGARRFFVARLGEAIALRDALGPPRQAAIHVLDGCSGDAGPALRAHDLVPVLNSPGQVESWRREARAAGRPLPCALHLDTGLNRLGLAEPETRTLAADPGALDGLAVELVLSHLACASDPDDPMNAAQARRFSGLAALFPAARTSLAASAGLFMGRGFHGEVVRPGIALYGGGPFNRPDPRIRPVASLMAPLVQVREIVSGESVGYGALFRAERPMQVAIAAIGYADGILRSAERARYGWLKGARRAVLGRISMDLIAVDATGSGAAPGDAVELFGQNHPIDEAARDAGSVAYELLTGVGPRVKRRYVGDAAA